jgi:sugar phosphate isomerase/epimerase/HEAT repeat protein
MKFSTLLFAGLGVAALCLAGALAASAAEVQKPTLEEAFKALPAYQFGQTREPLTVISDAVRDSYAKAAERAALVGKLAAALSAADTTPDAKRFILRELSIAGTAREVPLLAGLLLDKDLSDMARYAMERIPDPSALAAMRAALPKAAGKQKIGIINSLGQRKDAASVPALAPLLKDSDAGIASAAAAALGRIATPQATAAIAEARTGAPPAVKAVLDDSYLLCADELLRLKKNDDASAIYQGLFKISEAKQVRMAALRGIIAAGGEKTLPLLTELLTGTDREMQAMVLRFLRETTGPGTTKALVELLPKLPPPTQALLLEDLATRGDPSALPAVTTAAQSSDEVVKVAAVKAMGRLGDASTLETLVGLAAGAGPLADEARRSLDRLPGSNVNPAMIAMAEKGDAKARCQVIRSLGARRATAAVAAILKAAGDADAAVRLAAIQALDLTVDEKSAPALVGLVVKAKADDERGAAEKALSSLCTRATNKAACVDAILAGISGAETPAKCALVRALGRAGGAKALAAVRGFVRDADNQVQDAAVRSLADWPDVGAAADLLAIAKGEGNQTHQVLALRGYVRLAGLPDVQPADKLTMYQQAMSAAKRPDEKKVVLGGLGEMKTPDALKILEPCLGEDALKEEASATAVKIAKAIGASGKATTIQVMQKVLETAKDGNIRKEAENVLKALGAAPAKKAAARTHIGIYAAPADNPNRDCAAAEKLGWRLCMQSYTFNHFTFAESLEKTASLGLKYIEIYPGQKIAKDRPGAIDHNMSDEAIAEMKKMAADKGIKIVCYGVVGLDKNEAADRKVFEFAKKVGIEVINSEPPQDSFDLLDKLTEEYNIKVGLHNHPKASRYWDADTVLKALEGHSRRIGSDADTGHWNRSGLDSLECVKKLEGHIVALHFKDLKDGHDVPWGTGNTNVKGILEELARQGFKGVFSIEYEYNWDNSVPEIAKCVEFFNATADAIAKKANR